MSVKPKLAALKEPRRVTVLGSTGTIGKKTLDLIAFSGQPFEVEALSAQENWRELAEQAKRFKPAMVAIGNGAYADSLKHELEELAVEVLAGEEGIEEAASRKSDWTMAAIVGCAGLKPVMAAVGQGGTVALANKECLVAAGAQLKQAAKKSGAILIPVDSEHSAILQCFNDKLNVEHIAKITLTASGGPFLHLDVQQMTSVTPDQAVSHPKWKMGEKISVDSATMMNKGLELIEACQLFDLEESQVEILVHPESIIHGMVAYKDGSVMAQMGTPDMTTPIAVALAWPERMETSVEPLDLAKLGKLTFMPPDEAKFPSLRLAREALKKGGGAPAVLNAANEVAVEAFLLGKLPFLAIAEVVRNTLERFDAKAPSTLEEVLAVDGEARQYARMFCQEFAE